MKYLRLILCLFLIAFIANSSFASADSDSSVRILVAKAGETTAQITIGSRTYHAPISFEDTSFSWTDVKDAYSVPPAYASLIEDGRISIYIGCSGASFSVLKRTAHSKKEK